MSRKVLLIVTMGVMEAAMEAAGKMMKEKGKGKEIVLFRKMRNHRKMETPRVMRTLRKMSNPGILDRFRKQIDKREELSTPI
jgi:putative NADPH-quinone reductase